MSMITYKVLIHSFSFSYVLAQVRKNNHLILNDGKLIIPEEFKRELFLDGHRLAKELTALELQNKKDYGLSYFSRRCDGEAELVRGGFRLVCWDYYPGKFFLGKTNYLGVSVSKSCKAPKSCISPLVQESPPLLPPYPRRSFSYPRSLTVELRQTFKIRQ